MYVYHKASCQIEGQGNTGDSHLFGPTQTEMQYRCSVVQCILQVYCGQYSVAVVYTVHAVSHTLQLQGTPHVHCLDLRNV